MDKLKFFLRLAIGVVLIITSSLLIASEKSKTEVDQLLHTIESIKISDIEQATKLLDQIEPKSKTLDPDQYDKYLLLKSHNHLVRNQFSEGLALASKIIHQSKNINAVAQAMSRRAMAYLMTGKYKLALIDTFEALDYANQIDDDKVISSIFVNATSLHMELGLQKKGYKLLLKNLALAKKNNDTLLYCESTFHLGDLEYNHKNYALALKENTNAMKACADLRSKMYMTLLKAQRARILGQLNRAKEGIELINAEDLNKLAKSWPTMEASLNVYKAELAYQNKEYQRAIERAMLAYEVAKKDNSLKVLHDATRVIILSYKALGNKEKYIQYYKDYQYSGVKVHLDLERQKLLYYQVMNSNERDKLRQAELAKLHIKNALSEVRP